MRTNESHFLFYLFLTLLLSWQTTNVRHVSITFVKLFFVQHSADVW